MRKTVKLSVNLPSITTFDDVHVTNFVATEAEKYLGHAIEYYKIPLLNVAFFFFLSIKSIEYSKQEKSLMINLQLSFSFISFLASLIFRIMRFHQKNDDMLRLSLRLIPNINI